MRVPSGPLAPADGNSPRTPKHKGAFNGEQSDAKRRPLPMPLCMSPRQIEADVEHVLDRLSRRAGVELIKFEDLQVEMHIHACMYANAPTCIHAHMHVPRYVGHRYANAPTYIGRCMHAYMHTCMSCVDSSQGSLNWAIRDVISVHAHTHIHARTCMQVEMGAQPAAALIDALDALEAANKLIRCEGCIQLI